MEETRQECVLKCNNCATWRVEWRGAFRRKVGMQIPFGAVIGGLPGKIKATIDGGFRRNFPPRKGEALSFSFSLPLPSPLPSLFRRRFVPERRICAARETLMRRLRDALSFEASPPEAGR